jgi:hypothetical protein
MPTTETFTSRNFELEIHMDDWVRQFNLDGEDYIRAVHADNSVGDEAALEVVNLVLEKSPVDGFSDSSLNFTWDVDDADRTYVYINLSFTVTTSVETYGDLLTESEQLVRVIYKYAMDNLGENKEIEGRNVVEMRKRYQAIAAKLRELPGMEDAV